ncbi:MAG: imidazolonepropionase [Syntrophobacteraceae bacterium CG2_30_61_12]|nr:MAG: imidazolonepropionase [Syntrophobacteraceae bacterium CG2_30_61_12]PIU31112.1 MAG: imidazolonepropionase [Syntrophobacteraceae bacterium CG07_land_8_20_14_0_80_61_8]
MSLVLYRNAHLATPIDPGRPLAGPDQGRILHQPAGALLCRAGTIAAVGEEAAVLRELQGAIPERTVDCGGRCLVPGFVDPHTHMCFAERREAEFGLRLEGLPYLEILRRGGGILASVQAVRPASEATLLENTRRHARSALRFGTTSLEVKSGYGLDLDTELKMLRVIERLSKDCPLDVVATFLGAHAIPPEYREIPDRYVDLVVDSMLPAVAAQGIARYCDVFCETGVFTLEQSRRILKAAARHGLGVKIHADEVNDLGGAGLAAELRAASAEHLLAAADSHLQRMAAAGVIAVLLPATAYSLRKDYARARRMIELGVPVALATDCNPGSSYCESMPFVFGLAVLQMGLSVAEALTAATLNAAYAIGLGDRVGSLEPGKQADFLVLDGKTPTILAYHAGVSPVIEVIKRGETVFWTPPPDTLTVPPEARKENRTWN